MEYKIGLSLNTTKPLGFHIHYICFKARASFSQPSTLYYEKLHFLTVKKIIIWHKILLLLDSVYSELFGTNFKPQYFKVLDLV